MLKEAKTDQTFSAGEGHTSAALTSVGVYI